MPSSNLGHFARTPPTTRRFSPRAEDHHAVLASVPRSFSVKNMADHMQFRRQPNVTGGIVPNSGTGYGGESAGHHQVGYRFPAKS